MTAGAPEAASFHTALAFDRPSIPGGVLILWGATGLGDPSLGVTIVRLRIR